MTKEKIYNNNYMTEKINIYDADEYRNYEICLILLNSSRNGVNN